VIGVRIARILGCLLLCIGALARASDAAAPIPSFKDLEALGARVGTIRIDAQNVFDLTDPREGNSFFRTVNMLHIGTRPSVIAQSLLFKTGEPVSVQKIEETERILRTKRYLYDAQITPAAYHDGVVDIDVVTRDTWTLNVTGKFSRSGGNNTTSIGLQEYNVLGTGARIGFAQMSDVDRHGNVAEVSYPQAFDGWTEISYLHGSFNDGKREIGSITRPFYALDTRWAAGATTDHDDQIDSVYNAGDIVAKFRHDRKTGEVFGGWSPGLIGGWTQRYSLGATAQDDAYAVTPDAAPPPTFPVDHRVRGPFARYELVEDRFLRTRNREQIARTEFFALGLNLKLEVTRSTESWGASQSSWLYSAKLSEGHSFSWGHDVLGTLVAERTMASTGEPLDHQGGVLKYYGPQTLNAAFYGSITLDRIGTATAPDQLELGGDNGLRGYPTRYQQGEKRALFSLEERYYTDWYPFRLIRVGGAVFYDHGRAWGGVNQNTVNGGWLRDVGIGLRLSFDRTAFANVLHADIAVPLDRTPEIKSVQYLVKTQLTF